MPIRFTAARCPLRRHLSASRASRALGPTANDNEARVRFDRTLHAALHHFARHGLHAARDARQRAEQAFFAGDSETYREWRGICRAIDERMAGELDRIVNRPQECQPLA